MSARVLDESLAASARGSRHCLRRGVAAGAANVARASAAYSSSRRSFRRGAGATRDRMSARASARSRVRGEEPRNAGSDVSPPGVRRSPVLAKPCLVLWNEWNPASSRSSAWPEQADDVVVASFRERSATSCPSCPRGPACRSLPDLLPRRVRRSAWGRCAGHVEKPLQPHDIAASRIPARERLDGARSHRPGPPRWRSERVQDRVPVVELVRDRELDGAQGTPRRRLPPTAPATGRRRGRSWRQLRERVAGRRRG